MSALAGYIAHLERHGPECVLETAAFELPKHELAQLAAFLETKKRTDVWRHYRANGAWHAGWEPRRHAQRPCEHCGLDLPPGARANMRRHAHCRAAAARQRARDTVSQRAATPSRGQASTTAERLQREGVADRRAALLGGSK